ncbi:hypothetical protein [Enterobacter sp. PTB]|uniref:hypothetical protein n=1 Tax=Enterobacter sp. PTB TaxID=3143437 RepID=UPI003DA9754C
MKQYGLLLPFLFLQGCNDTEIDSVKSLVYGYDQSLNVGNMLDHRTICNSANWTQSTDKMGRKVVEYKCELKGVKDYSTLQKSAEIKGHESSKAYTQHLMDGLSLPVNDIISQDNKEKMRKRFQMDLSKLDTDIHNTQSLPLGERAVQVLQWSLVQNQKPVLMNAYFDIKNDDGSEYKYTASNSASIDSIMRLSYDNQITNYAQLVRMNSYSSLIPKWPFH